MPRLPLFPRFFLTFILWCLSFCGWIFRSQRFPRHRGACKNRADLPLQFLGGPHCCRFPSSRFDFFPSSSENPLSTFPGGGVTSHPTPFLVLPPCFFLAVLSYFPQGLEGNLNSPLEQDNGLIFFVSFFCRLFSWEV